MADEDEDQRYDGGGIKIDLLPTGDAGSGFRTQNDPSKPYQRANVVERKGAVDIRCSCLDIIHGLYRPDDDAAFCTLLVLQFRFDPRKRARRIQSADVELRFAGEGPGAANPEVFAISPHGRFSFSHTTQTETVMQGAELALSADVAGAAGASGGLSWSRSVTRDMTYATTVTGSIDLRGRNFGKSNCASWTLLENEATKTGVPASMTAAVLLKRDSEEPFRCDFAIKARADWRSSVELLFGSTPPDDPVLFDPTLESTSTKYDELSLGGVNLESISDAAFMNVKEGVVKTTR
ncbi:hypothetical protein RB598_005241 [Gaeumannomyces tritici]